MKVHAKLRRLYFLKGPVPTPEELAEAELLGMTAFRNSRHPGNVERCECVAGAVPEAYLKAKVKVLTSDKAKGEPTKK